MNLFFTPAIENQQAILDEEESAHAVRVLRMKDGDEIFFTDGNGNFYTGSIQNAHPKKTVVSVNKTEHSGRPAYSLHVAIAPTKSIDRLEWFLEKATEIGIDEITPLICRRSERREVKTARLNKVLVSAMKQSLKSYLPKLNEPASFEKFTSVFSSSEKFICSQDADSHLKNVLSKSTGSIVLIGPEGDFTDDELLLAGQNNYLKVNLGATRLRTETAGVVACSIVSLLNH